MDIVVSHDSGGAELISCFINYTNKKKNFYYCLHGPAKKIFEKNIGNFKNISFDKIKNTKFKRIITGTSWESDIENKAILYGKKNKIKTITYLDHWNNYKERFKYKEKLILPDEIFVTDRYALQIAKKKFLKSKITLKQNFYKLKLLKELKNKSKSKNKRLLYLTEPIIDYAKKQYGKGSYFGYDEFTLIKKFFQKIDLITKEKLTIIIRNHPSEKKSKYLNIIKNYKARYKIILSKKKNLYDDLNRSDIIIGNQSMAMVMGIFARKKIYSVLPNLRHKVLPHKNIKYL